MSTFPVPDGLARDDAPLSNDIGLVVRPIFSGPIDVEPAPSTTTGPVAVAANPASTQLLAADPTRLGFSIRNTSTYTLYVSYAAAASIAVHTVALVQNAYYEDPYACVTAVFGIWAAPGNSGEALVTAYTPAP